MSAKRLYSITVLLALCQVIHEVTGQQCSPSEQKREVSIFGMMLQGHIFKKITGATLGNICLQECYRDVRCQSFNFVIYQDMCELNNRTKEARPEDFMQDPTRLYMIRANNKGTLSPSACSLLQLSHFTYYCLARVAAEISR